MSETTVTYIYEASDCNMHYVALCDTQRPENRNAYAAVVIAEDRDRIERLRYTIAQFRHGYSMLSTGAMTVAQFLKFESENIARLEALATGDNEQSRVDAT
jgi:hypothetical protein